MDTHVTAGGMLTTLGNQSLEPMFGLLQVNRASHRLLPTPTDPDLVPMPCASRSVREIATEWMHKAFEFEWPGWGAQTREAKQTQKSTRCAHY